MTHSFPTRRSSVLRALPRHRVWLPAARRVRAVRTPAAGNQPGRPELGNDPAQARRLPPRLRRLRRGSRRRLRRPRPPPPARSEEHTSELQSLMRISYAVFCLTKTTTVEHTHTNTKSHTT